MKMMPPPGVTPDQWCEKHPDVATGWPFPPASGYSCYLTIPCFKCWWQGGSTGTQYDGSEVDPR
jgi:hypothetical protein